MNRILALTAMLFMLPLTTLAQWDFSTPSPDSSVSSGDSSRGMKERSWWPEWRWKANSGPIPLKN